MSKTILLIEADEEFSTALTSAFEARGASVEQSTDGKAAPGLAESCGANAIVLCVELPKMSGYAVCNKLKKNNKLKDIPLLIMSSEATPKTFEQHKKLKTRADEYVIKPCDADEVVEKIHSLIGLEDGSGDEEIDLLDAALEGLEMSVDADDADDDEGTQIISAADLESDDLEDIDLENLEVGDESFEENDSAELAIDALGDFGDDEDESLEILSETDLEEDSLDLDALESDDEPEDDDALVALDALDPDDSVEALEELGDFDEEEGDALSALDSLDELEDVGGETAAPSASPATASPHGSASSRNTGLEEELARTRKERDEMERQLTSAQDDLRSKSNELEAFKSGGQGAASSKDMLRLKSQLTSRDKEILALKESLNEKEKAALEGQERENELEMKAVDLEETALQHDAQVKTLEEKIQSQTGRVEKLQAELDSARDEARRVSELEATVEEAKEESAALTNQVAELGARMAEATAQAGEAQQAVEALNAELEEARGAADAVSSLEEQVQTLESENAKHEDRLLKAFQTLKGEEKLREGIRKALSVALDLLDEAPSAVMTADDLEDSASAQSDGELDGVGLVEDLEDDLIEDQALDALEL